MPGLDDFEPQKTNQQLVNYPQPRLIQYDEYKPIDTWAETNKALKISTGVGLIAAATLNAVRKERVGALGVITHSGGTLFALAIGGASYRFFASSSANLRKQDDSINQFYAGSLTGSLLGTVLTKKLVPTVGLALGLGATAFLVHWTGGLSGKFAQSAAQHRGTGLNNNFSTKKSDIVEKQGFWEVARRRPLSQTLEQLGEGAFKP